MSMVLFTFVAMAQSMVDVGAKYNEANGLYKEKNYTEAITAYQAGIKLSDEVGVEADELKGKMEKQLMNSYYKNGLQYKKIGLDASIASLERAYALAGELNDDAMRGKSAKTVAKLRSAKGNSFLKKSKLDDAFAEYEMAIEMDAKCIKAYYGKAAVYKSKKDYDNMMIDVDKVIELGGDNAKLAKTVKKANTLASKALFNAGLKELENKNGKKAIDYINMSFKYAPGTANSYYYIALANNISKNWSDAITAANKAISLETGEKSDMYFALGQAYEGNGDAAGACAAYKNVTAGGNLELAKYQITQVLKCK